MTDLTRAVATCLTTAPHQMPSNAPKRPTKKAREADFDPAEHPRDEGGKFTVGTGGTQDKPIWREWAQDNTRVQDAMVMLLKGQTPPTRTSDSSEEYNQRLSFQRLADALGVEVDQVPEAFQKERDRQQAALKAAGVGDTVTLYRGVGEKEDERLGRKSGLSSWTDDYDTAKAYSDLWGSDDPEREPVVYKAKIKREDVVASPHGSPELAREREWIVNAKVDARVAKRPADVTASYNDADETVTMLHGTTVASADAIMNDGFKSLNARSIANAVEDRYGLPTDSVFDHPAYGFETNFRAGDENVYLTGQQDVAQSYTNPEPISDALAAAYQIMHPEWGKGIGDRSLQNFVDKEKQTWGEPAMLAVTVPWRVAAKAFQREFDSYAHFKDLVGPIDEHTTFAIQASALKGAKIRRVKP